MIIDCAIPGDGPAGLNAALVPQLVVHCSNVLLSTLGAGEPTRGMVSRFLLQRPDCSQGVCLAIWASCCVLGLMCVMCPKTLIFNV
jgi:hypothetical protein